MSEDCMQVFPTDKNTNFVFIMEIFVAENVHEGDSKFSMHTDPEYLTFDCGD
jgi:hypothetical protein